MCEDKTVVGWRPCEEHSSSEVFKGFYFQVSRFYSLVRIGTTLRGQARTSRNANKRRPSRKTMGDIKHLMEHVVDKVKDGGA
jgi:hypothetical protein